MNVPADQLARQAALTDRQHGLLVEAGAGSGKTAILAGRVALLIADGVEPRSIAAITFTELAAAELAGRAAEYVQELARGRVPVTIAAAFPDGMPGEEQRARLRTALGTLDELTCTTIHGFARELIHPYPVEADIDPGATVLDGDGQAELLSRVFEEWQREVLGGTDPGQAQLARILTAPGAPGTDTLERMFTIVRERQLTATQAPDLTDGSGAAAELERCSEILSGSPAAARVLADWFGPWRELCGQLKGEVADPLQLLCGERDLAIFTKGGTLRALRKKGDWVAAARTDGHPKAEAEALYEAALAHYETFRERYARLLETAADHVLFILTRGLEEVAERYRRHKREAALLDFDDLIDTALALLRGHADVREELAGRYRHVLIDEFQDTDPKQAEIVWRLTGIPDGDDWRRWRTRGGSRFVVGDPKQSIYRFRGADALTYRELSETLRGDPGAKKLSLTTNFRSLSGILSLVNDSFAEPLAGEYQPGYEPLAAWHGAGPGVAVRRLHVPGTNGAETQYAGERREAEAEAVADLILQLLEGGNGLVRGEVRPGDIALLTPTSTGMDIFERALDERGINVSSQAGKGFWRRQEVQDLVALTRALADPRDTLALGALLKGPLTGATLEELLDIAELLHGQGGQVLNTLTDPELLPDGPARRTLERLRPLVSARYSATPFALLSRAVAALEVRAILQHRHGSHAERALANLERFLEQSRGFAVSGLGEFARHVSAAWSDGESSLEGRADSSEDAVTLITIHSAKGLEWKVVIPVDMASRAAGRGSVFHDRDAGRLSAAVFGQPCSGHAEVRERDHAEQHAERIRLWYVAATRARELLVLPEYETEVEDRAWCRLVDWQLPEADLLQAAPGEPRPAASPADSAQTREEFLAEETAIRANLNHIERRAPSRRDEATADAEEEAIPAERFILDETATGLILSALDEEDAATVPPPPQLAVGTARGIVLHRLMEDLIGGLVPARQAALAARAAELGEQLQLVAGALDPAEIAALALNAWNAPEVAQLHGRLLAEVEVAGVDPDTGAHWAGIADAVALAADGSVETVLDWKSDRRPTPETLEHYRGQLRAYLKLTGAREGLIVMAETGETIRVSG